MNIIDMQSIVSEVEIPPVELDMVLQSLEVIVSKIPSREFQTRIGYYVEEVKNLIKKLHPFNTTNQSIENHYFSLSIDELIIINNALNESGFCLTTGKEIFQDVNKLIKLMKSK
jgi:hypothetical protein